MLKIHLTEEQGKEMLEMGHTLGTHTHTHVSVKSSNMSENEFFKEIINPKKILEEKFHKNIDSLSYPFGSMKDCLMREQLTDRTDAYKIAFTVEEIFNSKNTHLLEIGRYQPMSNETSSMLKHNLENIIIKNRT
jgi:peptidoglycan/xylan/chitin deacetylase (PgdA/CDA1 family)